MYKVDPDLQTQANADMRDAVFSISGRRMLGPVTKVSKTHIIAMSCAAVFAAGAVSGNLFNLI